MSSTDLIARAREAHDFMRRAANDRIVFPADAWAAAVIIQTLAAALEAAERRGAALTTALVEARATFDEYGRLHRAKKTPDGDAKAARNEALSLMLDAAMKEQR